MPDVGAFGSGFLTGLREGVEAALIVGIVLAYLARMGRRDRFPAIGLGVAAAVGLSIVLGIALFVTVGALRTPYEQLFEAATMLVAASIVTGMLFWMRRQAGSIKGQLLGQMDRALGEGGILSLALLAFASTIREGLETALFLVGQVTAAGSGGSAVVVGALVGLAAAAVIGVGLYRGSRRINLGAFFKWTGIGLIFVAAGLVSRAIHELVEIHVLTVATRPVFDVGAFLPDQSGLGAFLRAIAGYSSAPEGLVVLVYLLYLSAVLALYLRPVRPAPLGRTPGAGASSAASSQETPTDTPTAAA